MRYFVILLSLFTLYACSSVEFAHLDAKVDNQPTFGDGSDDLGIEGVMPTIGKIYIEGAIKGSEDGADDDMLKAHLQYTLGADLVYDNKTLLSSTGGTTAPQCEWASSDKGITFTSGTQVGNAYRTNLLYDETNDVYYCDRINLDFKKTGTEASYDPDSLVTVSYIDNKGAYITAAGSTAKFTARINLNTADRHNIISVATSPTTVLFHRKDGLFQAGYTAYRGALGLEKYIGSAMYEARVLAPGATDNVSRIRKDYPAAELKADKDRIAKWLQNSAVDNASGIYSESAFVSSYGPPIALPSFLDANNGGNTIDYKKLRIALLRHNNNPIIISYNKKMYTMGTVTNFNSLQLAQDYKYFIRSNDNWFAYSGVKVEDSADLYSKIHVGEIKPIDGTPAKFVTALSITSDLDTTIALNEYDKEYYIAGNPHWNDNFCAEAATYDETTTGFTYNYPCMYSSKDKQIGARKIVGLQKKLGDGTAAIITDSEIFYIGRDGKGYKIDIRPDGINGDNIRNGDPIVSELITWNDKVAESDRVENADDLYAIDMAYANMNHAVLPTLLLKDGSIVFTIRQVEGTGADAKVVNVARRFFINKNGIDVNKPGHPDNVRMVKLLGPSSAYGEDGNIYYFTDVPALGASYAPNSQQGTPTVPVTDSDYLAFVYGDPIQFLGDIASDAEKQQFFKLTYGKIDIDSAIQRIEKDTSKSLNGNFAFLPYNPLTGQVENFLTNVDGSIGLEAVAYRPFRTNSHLFVNMNKVADKSYISVPYYFYGFNYNDKISPSTWNYKVDGLMAAEVKHNNISKVFGTLKTPEIPFRYTPYGRNTTFFANKVGIFSFVDYNVRKIKSICQDTNGGAGDGNCEPSALNGDASLADNSTNFPDYFYVARNGSGKYAEEASGVNNYISTPIVKESRMTNYPNTKNYVTEGFEPQLLSSWYNYEFEELPSNPTIKAYSDNKNFAAYTISYWYDSISSRYTDDKVTYFKNNIDEFLGNSDDNISFYQYAYGVGEYRYYPANAYPVWRARKLNTEILPMQTRYGTLVPMSHGAAYGDIASMLVTMFNMTTKLNEGTGKNDTANYVANRKYVTGLYGFYDRDAMQSGGDLGANVFGSMIHPLDNMTTNKIGYIADTGIYMWRKGGDGEKGPISNTDINSGRFSLTKFPFAVYYNN